MIKLKKKFIKTLILRRRKDTHKLDYGHILIISGSKLYTGAPVLTANSSIRSGAGLVTLAIPDSIRQFVLPRLYPEIITLPIEDEDGFFEEKNIQTINRYIEERKVTSIALGPGLTTNPKTKKFVKEFIKNRNPQIPLLLDADGINSISEDTKGFKIPYSLKNTIITPHIGELSRLIKINAKEIKNKKVEYIKKLAKENNLICVLKGYNTIVTDGIKVYMNTTGNPGMATGGSGDVLTGIITALISQVVEKLKLLNAALVGVYIHGLAGDIAAKSKTQISLIPSDIIEILPQAFKITLE